MKSKIFVLFLISSLLISQVYSGLSCILPCMAICYDIGGGDHDICLGVCSISCGCGLGLASLLACLSEEASLSVLEEKKIISKKITDIKRYDYILTYEKDKPQFTKVISVIKSEGDFKFLEFVLESEKNTKQIKVTDNHTMIVIKNGVKKFALAKDIKVGDFFFSDQGFLKVKEIKEMNINTKYTLTTELGTALVDGILVSTICDTEVKEDLTFEEIMNQWRDNHHFICPLDN